jgi:hypothetical protein
MIWLTPVTLPSLYGGLSIERLALTLGSLLFSTTITVRPLLSWKVFGLAMLIAGVGPGFGIALRSIFCAETIPVKKNAAAIYVNCFFICKNLILNNHNLT